MFNFKFILFFIFCFCCNFIAQAQTGIGTTTPNASAKLDVYSTNKGFLPPRVTLTSATDATTIASPAEGLLVYNVGSVGLQAGYYYWNGASWATIATASSAGNGVTAMNMVKLYGEAYSTAAGKIAETNGYSFTVPVSGKYLFDFSSAAYALNVSFTMTFKVRQGTTDIGTDAQTSYNGGTHSEYNGKVEVNLQAGTTYNVYVTSNGVRNSYDYDRVYMKLVAGNLPVTGQSVDYVSVGAIYQSAVGDNRDLIFPTNFGGNIPYNSTTGVFTMSANKTYLFQAQIRSNTPSASGSYIEYGFVDATSNVLLINGTQTITSSTTSTAGYGSNPVINFIYTPTTNQSVKIRTTVNTVGTQLIVSGTANITQIGSSAIINPWVLNGNDVYNTSGKVGIGTNAPSQTLDVSGTAKITTTPTITTATSVLVKDPTTSQISEQPISFITGVAKFIRNTNQGTISSGTTVVFNSSSNNTISSYVSLNTSTGVITLQPGTYELNGSVGGLGGSSGFNGDCRVYSVFHNGTAYVGTGGVSETGPSGNWNGMPQNNSNYIITVAAGQTAQITLKAANAVNISTLSETADFSSITGGGGDAGRAWVVVRKYN